MKESHLIEKLKRDNKSLKNELDRRTKELSFFIDSGKALTSSLEFKKIIRIIMEKSQRLIKCEAWSLLLLDEGGRDLHFAATKGGRNSAQIKKIRIKLEQGIAGWVAKNGQPVIVRDARKDKRFHKTVDQRGIWGR